MQGKVNVLAVVVAAIVHFLLGAVWFTVMGDAWLRGIGKTMEQLTKDFAGKPAAMPYAIAFVCNLVLAYVLAWVIARTGEQTVTGGVKVALLLGLGILATTVGTNYVFEARSLQIFAINAGYPVVGMLLMGIILGAWKKK